MGRNPAWAFGYVPSPAEWNSQWGSKFDATSLVGAIGNGATDDTASFRNAITALGAAGGIVYVPTPPVSYLLSGTITVPANVWIVGDTNRTPLKTAAGTYTLFSLTGSYASVHNFGIDNTLKSGGKDISIDVGSGQMSHNRISNIRTGNSFGVVGDSGSSLGLYQDLQVRNCWADSLRGIGFSFTRSFGSLVVEDCTGGFGGSSNPNFTVFALDNTVINSFGAVGGCFFKRCNAAGTGTSGANTNQGGFSFAHTAAVWISECIADTLDSIGFLFNTVSVIQMHGCISSLNSNFAMYFKDCERVVCSGNTITGATPVSSPPANVPGLLIDSGCSNMSWSGGTINACTGNGITVLANSGPLQINGTIITLNLGYGVTTAGTSGVLLTGLMLVTNTTGNYLLSGGVHYLRESMLSSGAVVSVGPGPISG